ncbi:MAG: YbaK/prolyl-tRNA synthetase associated protein [Ramlibacter sp.]|jgi:predicted Fe-S protein YdhL (DUF1289 family)|uniref:DUF1289 domain-containing protein n=1 Tax=Ramlibacter sp. TaxID=1917967 RepID=UPI00261472F0|nr:DUF1289 domain-containing protein [Ramlibacter sp.]MDB5751116.1 YbaK/prolyl-tRNA synthetase associated protein [Ramlibacter sp.]
MTPAAELLLETARELRAGQPVPSPCISICRLDADSGLCEGCFRTLDEITAWSGMPDAQRRVLWLELERRARGGPG